MRAAQLVAGIDKGLSPLALGTARFDFGSEELCCELLDQFTASGGTVVDTAHVYGDSEALIGAWMARRASRERLVVCTKGGHGENALPAGNLAETIAQELATSLERLQTDYVDLYWLHRDNPSLPVGRIVDCLNEHLDAGRIRAFGGSNWEYWRLEQANEYAVRHGLTGFAAVSNNLSLARPTEAFYPGLVSVDERGRRWHAETGIPLFSWSSQARGFFAGRYGPEIRDQAGGIEEGFVRRMIEVYCTDENFERLRRAEEIGRGKGNCSAVQVALAWVLHQPLKLVPIVGPRSVEELASCLEALSIELTESEVRWLNLEVAPNHGGASAIQDPGKGIEGELFEGP